MGCKRSHPDPLSAGIFLVVTLGCCIGVGILIGLVTGEMNMCLVGSVVLGMPISVALLIYRYRNVG